MIKLGDIVFDPLSIYEFPGAVTLMLITNVEDEMWWQVVTNNYKMLVTVLAILVTNIHYLSTLASDIQKMFPTSKFGHQL